MGSVPALIVIFCSMRCRLPISIASFWVPRSSLAPASTSSLACWNPLPPPRAPSWACATALRPSRACRLCLIWVCPSTASTLALRTSCSTPSFMSSPRTRVLVSSSGALTSLGVVFCATSSRALCSIWTSLLPLAALPCRRSLILLTGSPVALPTTSRSFARPLVSAAFLTTVVSLRSLFLPLGLPLSLVRTFFLPSPIWPPPWALPRGFFACTFAIARVLVPPCAISTCGSPWLVSSRSLTAGLT